MNPKIIFTVDLEDWFQVENLRTFFPYHAWEDIDLGRCKKNTYTLLDLFDQKDIRCTFFVLSWIAEKMPDLVREVKARGHEIASHGYYHTILYQLDHKKLKDEFVKSKSILEDIIGDKVIGYRAPNFSINDNLLHQIYESGYIYDSSYNSFSLNRRYGRPLVLKDVKGDVYRVFDNFYEFPVSNLHINNITLPWAGGAYFRLIPLFIFTAGVRYILRHKRLFVFYIHPWEIDFTQPRLNIGFQYRIRHYCNLRNTLKKLSLFLDSFRDYTFVTCKDYLKNGSVNS